MALNVKAAMLICMGFVGSMSWLLQGLARPERPVRSPLTVRSEVDVAGAYGDRPGWSGRLARSNAVEAAWAAASASGSRSARAEPSEAEPPRVLPPLVPTLSDPLETVVAGIREEYGAEPIAAVMAGVPPAEAGAETLLSAEAELPAVAAVASRGDAPGTYRVAKGDSLARIARRELKTSDPRVVQLLLDLNPQVRARRGQRVAVGELLTLPDAEAVRRAQAGVARGRQTEGWEWYTIQPNDSLASIARQQLKDARRWREILELNGGLDPRRIVPGMKIRLPSAVRVVSR